MQLATDERADLADFVEQLSPQQLDAPTLCTGWRVRDVVAHALGYDELSTAALVGRFAKGMFLVNRINAIGVEAAANRSPEQLCALVHSHVRPPGLAKGFGGRIALTDTMIHQQDIRRPLQLLTVIPADRMRVALQFARTAPLIRGAWRARGLRLVATDLDWSAGSGPVVSGTGEALPMVMAGRPAALADLQGPGVATVARRIGVSE